MSYSRRHFIKTIFLGLSAVSFPSLVLSQQAQSLIVRRGLLNKIPTRILSAGFVSDLMLIALCPEKMVGIATEIKEKSKPYLAQNILALPHIGLIAGRGSTAPLEKIISLNADLILDVGNVSATFLSTAEKISQQTQLAYFIVAGNLAESAQQFLELGELLQVQPKAKKLANLAQQILHLTHNICREDKISVYLARSADGLETASQGAIHTEVLDWLGLKNVATGLGEKKLGRVSMEQLLQWQPDLIVTQDQNFYQLAQQNVLWKNLSAVKNQRVFLAPDVPFNWLDSPPGINRLLGCIWLANKLKPNQITRSESAALVQEYFQLCYGYSLSEQQVNRFLA
ncbi:iron complex transport system substrate-binding protein [Pasteurella langaaensis DSM 22999]|uniref:Iron complex transport system substrate-binding protein n=1 Tax=Alitibacter langaaensis DSM 22999 TaxID=1122935 RepID=A0A2U0TGF0_9PAST|nr:ABC transporter substrate-binding protein [Pasteurella langaaensis]PVX42680.1 iron complex transport system substrate-binding protein [Pasteurella langaaensis DSM 22999]